MTEMKFIQGNVELKLTCWISVNLYNANYIFRLEQREKGKRKWFPIKEQKFTYVVQTDMDVILKYLSKEQVMSVAEMEHKNISPAKIIV